MLDRNATRDEALADWRELRDSITDPDEITRVYAEMTGWFAQTDPFALAEFTATQRRVIADRKPTRRRRT